MDLDLQGNSIRDITPLVESEGIDTGDEVNVRDNPLDCEDPKTLENIAALEARGVTLLHDCE